ncbi:hypothetical protein [Methylocystis parvus]|uniref:hypothetical protein n=1 Tax=Methylocystis parvus TaxID=134 RepID=UPI003C765983
MFLTHAELVEYSPILATIACTSIGVWLLMTDRTSLSYWFFGFAVIIGRVMEYMNMAHQAQTATALRSVFRF